MSAFFLLDTFIFVQMNLNQKQRFLYSLSAGLMMMLCFPYTGSITPLVFVALTPLLLVEDFITKTGLPSRNVFLHSFVCFIIYNIGTSYWIYNSSVEGGVFAFLFNTTMMCLAFQSFHFIKKYLGNRKGYLSLPFVWLGFEHAHTNWEFSHPWLSYGNVFSIRTSWVQWYEYTGVSGGTLWVIVINLLVFILIKKWLSKQEIKKTAWITGTALVIPIVFSLFIKWSFENKFVKHKQPFEVVIVQPNIDPYNEKFTGSPNLQADKFIELADSKTTPKTQLVVFPETALSYSFYEDQFQLLSIYPKYLSAVKKWNANILIGGSTMKRFKSKRSKASRINSDGTYTEYYNSSILIDKNLNNSFIHKSKLVVGVEKIPYSDYLPFLEDIAIDNGGIVGSLGEEDTVKVFNTPNGQIAPIVCYESIYPEFVAEQCRKGAELLCVITNDGWWGDTPGYKQHFSFSRLRAIENRRWLVRSANTGKSGVISPTGEVISETNWWEEDVLLAKTELLNQKTIFSSHGDYLGRSSAFVWVLIFVYSISKKILPSRK
jgi:apolipoprotein N-acyltransferase